MNNSKDDSLDSPLVSIIVLNWNGLRDTQTCLRSLQQISYHPIRIIVIDNGSRNSDADEIEREFGHTVDLIRLPRNLGFAEGNNVGIRLAIRNEAKYVCLINNDATVDPKFLDALVLTAEADETTAMVAPTMRSMKDHSLIDNLGITLTLSGLSFNRKNDQWRMFCPTGGAVLYRSSSLKTIVRDNNYFDPAYFAYVEDLDLGFRLLWQGFRSAYAPLSIVYHRGSGSTALMSDFALFQTQRNLLLTWIKNLPVRYLLQFGWLMFIVQCTHALLFLYRRQFFLLVKADCAALRLLPSYLRLRRSILHERRIPYRDLRSRIESKVFPMEFLKNVLHSLKYQ